MGDPIDEAGKAMGVAGQVFSLARDTPEFQEAGKKMAKSALTLANALENVLLPIAVVNFAFDRGRRYFEERFPSDLERVTSSIPEADMVAPKPSVAAPILQGLTFAHDEDSLREMFLALLASAMDRRSASQAHPAFVEIIRQLSSEEANLLKLTLRQEAIPIVQVRRVNKKDRSWTSLANCVLPVRDSGGSLVEVPGIGAMVDNWVRLGLVSLSFLEHLIQEGRYNWAEESPEYLKFKSEDDEYKVETRRGILRVTDFGRSFFLAVAHKQ